MSRKQDLMDIALAWGSKISLQEIIARAQCIKHPSRSTCGIGYV